MFFPKSQVRIWLYTRPTDMRKSYNGLSALVKSELQDNPLSGELFVFVNRRQNQMKILYFDHADEYDIIGYKTSHRLAQHHSAYEVLYFQRPSDRSNLKVPTTCSY